MIELFDDILSNRFLFTDFLWYALVSLTLFAVCCFWAYRHGASKRCFSVFLLIEYLLLVLCFTVICRKKGELEQFFPIPFYNYATHKFGVLWSEMVLNVLMFIPVGVLLKFAFNNIRWYHAMAIGFMLSVTIETLQWALKCGSCETNDLINNTVGCIIGFWVGKMICRNQH